MSIHVGDFYASGSAPADYYEEDATPCRWVAAVIVALAVGLACLPPAAAIAAMAGVGMPAPHLLWLGSLGLAGTSLAGFKVLSIGFGIGEFARDSSLS